MLGVGVVEALDDTFLDNIRASAEKYSLLIHWTGYRLYPRNWAIIRYSWRQQHWRRQRSENNYNNRTALAVGVSSG